jgi:hypothetical protein
MLAIAAAIVLIAGAAAAFVAVTGDDDGDVHLAHGDGRITSVAASPLSPRHLQAAVFDGHEVLVWGGADDAEDGLTASPRVAGDASPALGDGAAYDPATDTWRTLPAAPLGARFGAVAVWTGSEMLVVGGDSGLVSDGGIDFRHDGAAYDPAANTWRTIADAPGCPSIGTWTGTTLVVAGQCASSEDPFVVAEYDPNTNTWTDLHAPIDGAGALVAVGDKVVVMNGVLEHGVVFDRTVRTWSDLPNWPSTEVGAAELVADGDRLVWLGRLANSDDKGRVVAASTYDFATGTWSEPRLLTVELMHPDARFAAAEGRIVWTGWGTGYSWCETATWKCDSTGTRAPRRLDRYNETLVAIGNERFFVWGGRTSGNDDDPTNYPVADGVILDVQ